MKKLDLTRLSIVIVEKHSPMRAMLRGMLRELGVINISDYATPEEGFQGFNDKEPDLVLIDWAPDFDGLGLLQKIRRDEASHNPFAPVIMVTAHSEAARVIQARDAGMTEYLAKPVSAKGLYQRISSIVETQRHFVRASQFFGPDRRRKAADIPGEERRTRAVMPDHAAGA